MRLFAVLGVLGVLSGCGARSHPDLDRLEKDPLAHVSFAGTRLVKMSTVAEDYDVPKPSYPRVTRSFELVSVTPSEAVANAVSAAESSGWVEGPYARGYPLEWHGQRSVPGLDLNVIILMDDQILRVYLRAYPVVPDAPTSSSS